MNNVGITKLKGHSGIKECLVIPIEDNPQIFHGIKGCYLKLIAFSSKETDQYGNTHMLKANLPKQIMDNMSQEERFAQPILGNMKPLGNSRMQTKDYGYETTAADDDDLPF